MPAFRTVEEISRSLARTRKHNEENLDDLRRRIDEREARGLSAEDLRAQLAKTRETAERGEALAEAALAEAKEREGAQAARQETARAAKVAEIDSTRKDRAARAWEASGGKPADFPAAWPTIREEMLLRDTVQAAAVAERSDLDFKSL